MLVVMDHNASEQDVRRVCETIQEMGYQARPMPGQQRTTVGLVGNDGRVDDSRLAALPGVSEIIHVTKPYKQVSREWKPEPSIISLPGGLRLGGPDVVVMAGPCSVETEEQIVTAARAVRDAGATVLRAGAFKPRSSPYSFQGLGEQGLRLLADIIQIGARNMQNYSLLKKVGRLQKPVLLKRGLSATISELLLSAEYILNEGNPNVVLCERGVRGFDTATRNLFDLSAIPLVHGLSHLPIIADPSHGTGHREMVIPMARAAVAAGADGLLIEVHPWPDRALSDGAQSLAPEQFVRLMREIRSISEAIGRRVARPSGVQV
jgi:3-deoxy-7-phosphoheptulonate synthase